MSHVYNLGPIQILPCNPTGRIRPLLNESRVSYGILYNGLVRFGMDHTVWYGRIRYGLVWNARHVLSSLALLIPAFTFLRFINPSNIPADFMYKLVNKSFNEAFIKQVPVLKDRFSYKILVIFQKKKKHEFAVEIFYPRINHS